MHKFDSLLDNHIHTPLSSQPSEALEESKLPKDYILGETIEDANRRYMVDLLTEMYELMGAQSAQTQPGFIVASPDFFKQLNDKK